MTSGRAIPSRGSCDVQTDPLDGFDFRADGFFLDAFGAPCVLLGTVEFTDFGMRLMLVFLRRWVVNSSTLRPMQKKTSCGAHNRIEFGKWSGRRRGSIGACSTSNEHGLGPI